METQQAEQRRNATIAALVIATLAILSVVAWLTCRFPPGTIQLQP